MAPAFQAESAFARVAASSGAPGVFDAEVAFAAPRRAGDSEMAPPPVPDDDESGDRLSWSPGAIDLGSLPPPGFESGSLPPPRLEHDSMPPPMAALDPWLPPVDLETLRPPAPATPRMERATAMVKPQALETDDSPTPPSRPGRAPAQATSAARTEAIDSEPATERQRSEGVAAAGRVAVAAMVRRPGTFGAVLQEALSLTR
ncbi:MAG: hypothetical protein EXR75_09135 [Myxococcales bacterium]|nr:hypothetical protein [Myxococcales bacterium]